MKTPRPLFPDYFDEYRGGVSKGVLPSQMIRDLVTMGHIRSNPRDPIQESQIQPASIDLRLGDVAYRVRASFLPGDSTKVLTRVQDFLMSEIDLSRPTVFEKGSVYIVRLLEELSLPRDTSAKGNPKSTTGRLDVFTRLITDNGKEFERVPSGYHGPLFAEVVPRTFTVRVQKGLTLSQLRFIRGRPKSPDAQLKELNKEDWLVYGTDERPSKAKIQDGLWVSVNLCPSGGSDIVGYRAKKNAPLIDLENIDYYDPGEFWDLVDAPATGGIILNPGDFYILGSKERLSVPPDFAAEMVAMDPSLGEFRIHYAGFFDPGFGYGMNESMGTPAVLEVRAHEVPFVMEDGQFVGRLIYSRLLARPDKLYGPDIGSTYQRQALALSKHFKRN
jgi:dCTP deaminase